MEISDYCDYKLSIALKAAGFDELCRAVWHFDGKDFNFIEDYGVTFKHPAKIPHWNTSEVWGLHVYSAPTLWQAQKWFREKKGIAINVIAHDASDKYRDGKYHWEEVHLPNSNEKGPQWVDWFIYGKHPLFDTYEEALSDGLSQMLELINKGE